MTVMEKTPIYFVSYYAVTASRDGFGVFKVTAHKGKLVDKGPVIRHFKEQREAVAFVRDMNYGGEAVA